MLRIPLLAWGILLAPLAGCGREPAVAPKNLPAPDKGAPGWFEDVTDQVGLDFHHDAGPTGDYFTPATMASGCAFFDHDGDGLLDIYLLQNGGPKGKKNRLFRQDPPGKYRDVSPDSGLDISGYNQGVAIGDANNDGRPDVVVTQYGGLKFFVNEGKGRFRECAAEAGLINPLWGSSAAFFDYDRDGRLDLVVVNYMEYDSSKECRSPNGERDFCGPTSFAGRSSKLFRNVTEKDGPIRFQDVSTSSGVGRVPGHGLGVVCADFDGDRWPDIFVANDGEPNRLYMNRRDGTFAEESVSRGVAYTVMGNAYAGMGVAVGDADNNGMLDLYVTHLNTETHTLWRQGPRGQFRDMTAPAGLMVSRWRGTGFGTLFADFDHNGGLDIAIANGRIIKGSEAKGTALGFWESYADRNQLFANDGTGKFKDVSPDNAAFCGYWNVARGLACADFDGDGAPDLLVNAINDRARLFRNVAPKRGHWLKVHAFDPGLRREAYGAEVRVRAGKKEWFRLANPAESYLSSSSPLVHIGLGDTDRIDAVEVIWPDGTTEAFPGGPVDRTLELRKGEGRKS